MAGITRGSPCTRPNVRAELDPARHDLTRHLFREKEDQRGAGSRLYPASAGKLSRDTQIQNADMRREVPGCAAEPPQIPIFRAILYSPRDV